MKKTIFAFAFVLTATVCVNSYAQENGTGHEFRIALGGLSNSDWISFFEEATNVIFGAKYDNEKYVGPVSAEYFYHMKDWLSIGAITSYGRRSQDYSIGSTREGKYYSSYLSLMPAAKFDWLKGDIIGLYSKLGVGATLRKDKVESDNGSEENSTESNIHVNWQLSLLGVEAGSRHFRAFMEIGMGEQGVGLIGARYKF